MKRIHFFSIAVLLCLLMGNAYASYEDAVSLFEQKKYRESLDMCAEILVVENDFKPGSDNYKIRYLAAHNHWKLDNTKSAESHLTRCMDIDKTKVDPYIDLSLFYLEEKRFGDADRIARKGLEIEESPYLFYVIGMSSMGRKNYWQAKPMFEKANSLKPDFYRSYNALGIVLMNLNKYSEANTAFSVALALRPNLPEINNNMGVSLEKMNRLKEAYRHYSKANKLDDSNRVILENLARVKDKLEE